MESLLVIADTEALYIDLDLLLALEVVEQILLDKEQIAINRL
jgi:hypothetical protein